MKKKQILFSITAVLTLLFGAFFLQPFLVQPQQVPEVQAVSEQPVYIPTNYRNIGIPMSVVVLEDGSYWYPDQQNGRVVKVSASGEIERTVGRYGSTEGEFEGDIMDIAVDNEGYLYVQTFQHTYKLDFNGGFIKMWGVLGSGPQDYSNPGFIHYDEFSDSIYVSNSNHNEVMKFTKDGVFVSEFGTEGTGNGEFRHPTGITTDSSGRIYVMDGDNERGQVFSSNGTFLFTFGGPGSGDGQFTAPQDVLIKANGNIVVASQNSRKIQEFDSEGNWVTSWGEGGSSAWQFLAPRGLSQDSSGNIYVSDWTLKSIQKFTSTGTYVSSVRNSGNVSGKLTVPTAVAYDSIGNLYVLDNGAYEARVQKFTNAGTYLSTIIEPEDMDIASYRMKIKNDELYITEYHGFKKFDLNGNLLLTVAADGTGDGQFINARGIDVDSSGNIYVADGENARIQKFDSAGNYLAQWGTRGTGNGQFGWPEELIIDGSDNIYVADNQWSGATDNTRIQVFNTSGVYQRTIGSFGSDDGQFFTIGGMALDAEGKLHVSEAYFTKIQVFNADGTYSHKYAAVGGDNGGVRTGSGVEELFEPAGLALNPISDNMTIADSQNHRVQLMPSGTRIYNLISSADVLSNTDSASLVYRYYDPQSSGISNISSSLYFGDYVVSDFSVNLSQDRDWVNVNVLTLPNESKSLVVNLDPTNAPGVSSSHSLYIVKQAGQTSVRVCPDADQLAEITEDCAGGYELTEGSPSLSSVTIGGKTYWKVTGLTGTGIMSVAGDVTPTPTPTSTITSTPTATVTGTVTATATPTPTSTTTVTSIPLPTGTIIAAVTLPPAVKGDNPVCPTFESFTVSQTLIKRGESVKIAWTTKNTEIVRMPLSVEDLPAVGEYILTPEKSIELMFTADNGYCTAKKTANIMVVDSLPWTNTITVGTGLLLVEAALAIQQPVMFGNVWLAIAGFLSRKKRQTWGIVYHSGTKKPLGRAIIRLLREDKTIADTVVSEANGTFRLTPKVGKYTVVASLGGYTFPSTVITAENDGGFTNVYRGQVIEVSDTSKGILLSIPMDSATMSDSEKRSAQLKGKVTEAVEFLSNLLVFAGFAYGLYVAYQYPHAYNYAILAVYGLFLVLKLFLVLPKKTVGRTLFSDGSPVAGVELGLFDTEFKNLLYRTFTNDNGEYSFVVPNQTYNLKVMDDRYRIAQKGQLVQGVQLESRGKDTVRVITNDFTLE